MLAVFFKKCCPISLCLTAFGCQPSASEMLSDSTVSDSTVSDSTVSDSTVSDSTVSDSTVSDSAIGACPGWYNAPTDLGLLAEPALVETSGLVASRGPVERFWMHNDSGDGPRVFAVGPQGQALGQVTLEGIAARDLEDIATSTCPDGQGLCLWLADTGDNGLSRTDAEVLAFPEPSEASGVVPADQIWHFPVTYPGGPVDVEALAVAPDGSTFWLFEKVNADQFRVFRHPGPLLAGRPTTLIIEAAAPAVGVAINHGRSVTGADLHPNGARLLLRVYTGTYEYRLTAPAQQTGLAALLELEPTVVALGPFSEEQGEAVSYDFTGQGVVTVSESTQLEPGQPLHHYTCHQP